MEHVENLFKDSENLDVIVKGTVTGKSVNTQDEVLYQIETPCGDYFEANEKCVYHDVTKPVEVHQCVADWYEENKDNLDYNLWNYIMDWEDTEEDSFKRWVNNSKDAFQTIINMHQFGYKIKEEKKYTVKVNNTMEASKYLKYDKVVKKWYFGMISGSDSVRLYHTKEELISGGFEWVLSCEGVEVEEVKE